MPVYELNLSTTEDNTVGLIKIRQDDNMTQTLRAKITENGEPEKVSGRVVFFNAMKNGRMIARDLATITSDNSTVEYTLHPAFYSELGNIDAFFSFEINNGRESTANFKYQVIPGACRNINGSNYIYEFEELGGIVDEIINTESLRPLIQKDRELQAQIDGLGSDLNTEMTNISNALDGFGETLGQFEETMTDYKETLDNDLKDAKTEIKDQVKNDLDTLREELKKQEVKDSGWMDLELASGSKWHDIYPGQFRIIGKHVYLRGCVLSKEKAFEETPIAKIPRAYAPSIREAFTTAQMSSIPGEIAQIAIWPNGEIQVVSAVSKEKNVYINQVDYPLV